MEENSKSGVVTTPVKENFGYHTRAIEKGELGCFSKIREEYEELQDAYEQGDKIMQVCECSDLIGAIAYYVDNISEGTIRLADLIKFNEKTERAFKAGKR